jgi:hypothetical protein
MMQASGKTIPSCLKGLQDAHFSTDRGADHYGRHGRCSSMARPARGRSITDADEVAGCLKYDSSGREIAA